MVDPERGGDDSDTAEQGGEGRPVPVSKLLVLMLAGVALGVPLVAYLWETVHQILALELDTTRLLVSIPLATILVVLLRLLGKFLWSGAGESD